MGMIIGYEKEKNEIAQLRDMLHNADRYRAYGVRIPRGLVLYGEPGVGKTVLAKSVADEGISLVELRAANCCEEEAVSELKDVFRQAKATAPAVLLLDELDKIAGTSDRFMMEMNDNVKKALLQELDTLTADDTVLVVATCNDTDSLGEALLRPGRFDRQLHIEPPDEVTRGLILRSYFARLKVPQSLDFDYLSRLTYGYTGARLECLANEAGIMAMHKDDPSIDLCDIRIIMNRFAFGGDEKNPTKNQEDMRKVAVHEAGHALAALLLAPDCLHGASILPQGNSHGHIQFIAPEDRMGSVAQVENEVAILLAGHVAEKTAYGEYFLGVSSDIQQAMIRLHYLATKQGAYGYEYITAGLRSGYAGGFASDEIRTAVCRKIEERLAAMDHLAERLITENQAIFEKIVEALMEKQTLTREELLSMKSALKCVA